MKTIEQVYLAMLYYYEGDPKRIQHFVKVHSFAKLLGEMEGISGKEQETLEIAALVHDIGIKAAEEKYGSCGGKLQEQEGPALAEAMLKEFEIDPEMVKRICWLVGHHHTYHQIEGADYQLLVEADFLVNLHEDQIEKTGIRHVCERIFKSESGRKLCRKMFGLTEK